MPQLPELPNETLRQIITSIHVDDIDSFASCSKHLRLLCGPVLQLHMERKREYSTISFGCEDQGSSPHAVMLMQEMLENPMTTLYPKKIIIEDCVETVIEYKDWFKWHTDDREVPDIKEALARCSSILSPMLDGCPYIETSSKGQWKQEIFEGNEYTAVAFLITMLPNLMSITISGTGLYFYQLMDIVSEIAAAKRMTPESFHPLQMLDTVRLEPQGDYTACYDLFEAFTELPSMRLLAGKTIDGCGCGWSNMNGKRIDDEDKNGHGQDVT